MLTQGVFVLSPNNYGMLIEVITVLKDTVPWI